MQYWPVLRDCCGAVQARWPMKRATAVVGNSSAHDIPYCCVTICTPRYKYIDFYASLSSRSHQFVRQPPSLLQRQQFLFGDPHRGPLEESEKLPILRFRRR